MRRLRDRRADIAPHDSAERLRALGVDVFFGEARFRDPRTIRVSTVDPGDSDDSNDLRFRKAVIATGSRPAVPEIPGLADVPFLTSDTIFDIAGQPRALVVIGGGSVGCEMAQAFARLGSRVTMIESSPRLLPRDDPDAAGVVRRSLEKDGVRVLTGGEVQRIGRTEEGFVLMHGGTDIPADALLVATGRASVVDGLDLEAAGIARDREGIRVDDRLRTTNPRVYAAGDVASRYQFTHAADALARTVIQNALFFGRRAASGIVIPWCTFTSPEVAHVGITSADAGSRGAQTITIPLSDVDRAVVDDETDGFLRVHHRRGRILGATIVARGAGEVIGTIASVMQSGATLPHLARVVFPYPTLSTALRQAGDAYQRTKLTPAMRRALKYYFRWSR
jgi:pyruvate/2-oxoglutarate dehydrogenase complex dihydrolipoamide dehydrogenase (E3) component